MGLLRIERKVGKQFEWVKHPGNLGIGVPPYLLDGFHTRERRSTLFSGHTQ